MTHLLDAIGNALAACVGLLLRFRRLTIAAVLAFAALSLHYTVNNLGINTDTANMISDQLPWRQHFIAYREAFPVRDRNLIALIDSDSALAAETYARRFASALRDEPQLFASVFLPGGGGFFERNGLLYLNLDELENLSDRLIDAQPMLGLIRRDGSGTGVVEMLTEAVAADASPGSADLDSLFAEAASVFDSAAAGRFEPFDWAGLIAPGESRGSRFVLLVQPELDFSRVQPARPAIERMRAVANELATEFSVPVTMRLTGTLAMEHEELESVTRGAGMAGVAALLMVAAVLFWALRSVVMLLISIVSLLVGLIGTAAFAAAAVGHLNLLSVAFAVLYVGLGVDFILHICLRLKELVAAGTDLEAAIRQTMSGVGASLVICAVTTAAGFYSFIPTPFEGVSELGLISGTGMFISLLVSVTLLPALLAQFYAPPSPSRPKATLSNAVRRPGRSRWPAYTIAGCGLLLFVCGAAIPGVSFDSNPVNLRDPDSESVQALEELSASSDAAMLSLVAIADDTRTASEWVRDLSRLDVVSQVLTADSLVPEQQDDKLFLLEDLEFVMGPALGPFDVRESRLEGLEEALIELSQTLANESGQSSTKQHLAESLDEFLLWLRASTDADSELRSLDTALIAGLSAELEALQTALSAEAFDRDALPAELVDRWFDGTGRELIEIIPAENVNNNEAAARFVDGVRAVLPTATGLPVVYGEASRTVVLSFQLALFYAFVLVSLILTLLMRSLRDAALVLAPILFAAIVTAGATAWLGIPFNFANIIALPLLVGVGVDNGIHMVHRMRTEPPGDGNPLHTSTSRAVLASGLTTVASFGNLAFSSHVGMASMGILLTLGMFVTLLATLGLLPALLRFGLRT